MRSIFAYSAYRSLFNAFFNKSITVCGSFNLELGYISVRHSQRALRVILSLAVGMEICLGIELAPLDINFSLYAVNL